MKVHIWNTLEKTLTEVVPVNPDGVVRIYNCGPTVYSTPHIGNIRRFIVADLLVKALKHLGYSVRSVMNITDVGHLMDSDHAEAGADKMLIASEREKLTPEIIAAKYTQEFFAILIQMRAEPADFYPRATMHVSAMIKVIENLITNGFAYETNSGIYFDVTKFSSYGKLSGNTTAEVEPGARVGVREEKRHAFDFVLWVKAEKEHIMQWDSPWGRGYPGWHIECSAMAQQLLGEAIDIHTGGIDNMFPHHENEIAQSEGASGKQFVKTWLHNELLLVDGKKMAKSTGGYITLNEIIKRGYNPLALKFLFLQTHYRSKLNFGWSALDSAVDGLKSLQGFVDKLIVTGNQDDLETSVKPASQIDLNDYSEKFSSALADDLGTPQAIAIIFEIIRKINPLLENNSLSKQDAVKILELFRSFDAVLGIISFVGKEKTAVPSEVTELISKREKARQDKNYSLSDELRKQIIANGFDVKDTAIGQQLTSIK
ncbi:MAG: cysteine--tRNA ligase [bacterium]|nr:cysteine--tRNA ligase [bacterium]